MRVAIHQPQYVPWLPYFDKIDAADVFVYLDNVQYQKNGVQNRNRVKTAGGPVWLTVPVHASRRLSIERTPVAGDRWVKKHVETLRQAYARAPFRAWVEDLAALLERPWDNLSDLDVAVTEWMCARLGLTTPRIRASSLPPIEGRAQDLVIGLCRHLGARSYLSGPGARAYQCEQAFRRAGVCLEYQVFQPPPWPQCHPSLGFVPSLSALDLLLNVGPRALDVLRRGRRSAA